MNNAIGRVTTTGGFTFYDLPPKPLQGQYNRIIQVLTGPDGALWFSDVDSNAIGRFTTTGALTFFSLPNPANGNNPGRLTNGPDGAIWFTERSSNRIDRITTSGSLTQFPTLGSDQWPWDITTGSDGALWFTTEPPSGIGRITTGGSVTRYPTGNCSPRSIAAGPDGALWFTCYGDQIGRISTGGAMTFFRVPSRGSTPGYILAGPDGALWFTEQYAEKVGRITTAGVITEFPLPFTHVYGSIPALASGPDGNLWFSAVEGEMSALQGRILKGVIRPAAGGAPSIIPRITGTAGTWGWYMSNVAVSWEIASEGSAVVESAGCEPVTLTDTAGRTLRCSATNSLGLSNSVSITLKVDKTLPLISGIPPAGCALWPPNHKLVQLATISAQDFGSGLVAGTFAVTVSGADPADYVITPTASGAFTVSLRARKSGHDGAAYTIAATARDVAGNITNLSTICSVSK
jgi:streptogramin lyase